MKHQNTRGTEENIWDFRVQNDAMEQFPRTVFENDDLHDEQEFTDSSAMPIFDINSTNKSIPSQLLLNTDCYLRPTRQPIRGTLLYPEAMLFSTNFYKSEEGGLDLHQW